MTKFERFEEITEQMREVYKKKNADYGDSFGEGVKELGIISAITRISDKCNRLKSLAKLPPQVENESMLDTLLDLANYAVMTMIEVENANDLKLKKDTKKTDITRFLKMAEQMDLEDYNMIRNLDEDVKMLWLKTRERHENEDINKLNDFIVKCVIVLETHTMTEDERFAFMVYVTEKQAQLCADILMNELSID